MSFVENRLQDTEWQFIALNGSVGYCFSLSENEYAVEKQKCKLKAALKKLSEHCVAESVIGTPTSTRFSGGQKQRVSTGGRSN